MGIFDKLKQIKYKSSFKWFHYQFYIYKSLFEFLGYSIVTQSDDSYKVYLVHPRGRHLRIRDQLNSKGNFNQGIDDYLYKIIYRNHGKVFFDKWFDGMSQLHKDVRSSVYYDIKPELDKRFAANYGLNLNDLRMILLKCEVNLHKYYFQEKFHILANDGQRFDYSYYELTSTFQRLLSMEKPILSEHDVIKNSYDNKVAVINMIDILKELLKTLGQNQNNKSWQRENYSFFSVPKKYIYSQNLFASRIIKPKENIIECRYCFQKNRLPKMTTSFRPKCAKCGSYLINFENVSMLEFINKLKSVDPSVNPVKIQEIIDSSYESIYSDDIGYPASYTWNIESIINYNKRISSELMRSIEWEYKKIKFLDNFPLIIGHDIASDFINLKLY